MIFVAVLAFGIGCASDGLKLLVQSWKPKGETKKGTLIIVHGLKDYADRYGELAFAAASSTTRSSRATRRGSSR